MAFRRVLDPMERISEIMFGVIMALTFTCTLGIATTRVETVLIGALGCNLAWGIIDGTIFLLGRLHDRQRKASMLRAMREAPDLSVARRIIADALPPMIAAVVPDEQLTSIRQKLHQLPDVAKQPSLVRRDLIGAAQICLLSFAATFPIAIPFLLIGDVRLALRVSNLVAIAMLAFCGYFFGYRCGLRPWPTAVSIAVIGVALVGVAILLGG